MEKNKKNTNRIVRNIQDMMGNLYKSTYYSSPDNKKLLNNTINQMDTSIDKLLNKIEVNTGKSNISSLYSRLGSVSSVDSKTTKEFESIFSDNTLMDGLFASYSQNKYIRDLDMEIDTVCKYMTQLEEALECKKDNVLSADSFNKDFINVTKNSTIDKANFNNRIEEIKDVYNLVERIEEIYDNASKYGEQYDYIIPYNKAFDKLDIQSSKGIKIENGRMLMENGTTENLLMEGASDVDKDLYKNLKINIEFPRQIVNEAVRDKVLAKKIVPNEFSLDADKDIYSDGLVSNSKKDETQYKLTGCYIKTLKRENVIPIYIDEFCLGYYYIESDYDILDQIDSTTDPTVALQRQQTLMDQQNLKKDDILKSIAGSISTAIDKKFINANQDLKNEIYLILKYNQTHASTGPSVSNFKVYFIPPEDMMHWYFKKDPVTHRGISDLSRALFPAKLYSCLYITSIIGVLTRGQDKRAYYVKQNVDTNISQTLLSTINQIKKSNFGLREINSLSNILNVTGKFNDYIIPVGPSGDSPIQFEIMPGQDIPIKTELMELLESMAVNSTGVPLDIIQNRQTADYALRLSMTSSKFQKNTVKRELKLQKMLSRYVTKIYNYHFSDNEDLKVSLPPPSYLYIQNTLSLLQNNVDYVNTLIDVMFDSTDSDEVKALFKKKAIKSTINTHINIDLLEDLKSSAILELEVSKSSAGEEEEDGEY